MSYLVFGIGVLSSGVFGIKANLPARKFSPSRHLLASPRHSVDLRKMCICEIPAENEFCDNPDKIQVEDFTEKRRVRKY